MKIRIAEARRLLEHWRGRISRGLAGIIWVPTSPLFGDQDDVPLDVTNRERRFREALEQRQDDSDEEVFVLPHSDEIDEDEYESNHGEQHSLTSYCTSHLFKDAMEEVMDASNASHLDEDISSEYCLFFFHLVC